MRKLTPYLSGVASRLPLRIIEVVGQSVVLCLPLAKLLIEFPVFLLKISSVRLSLGTPKMRISPEEKRRSPYLLKINDQIFYFHFESKLRLLHVLLLTFDGLALLFQLGDSTSKLFPSSRERTRVSLAF